MHIADIIIVLLCITALLRGAERGFVRTAASTLGLVVGFFVGAFVQGKLIGLAGSPASKAALTLTIIIGSVMLFVAVGEYLGNLFRDKIEAFRVRLVAHVDNIFGAISSGATVLLIVWLAAAIFVTAPLPAIQGQIKNSIIISSLNDRLPPAPNVVASIGHFIDPNSFPEVFTGLEPRIDTTVALPSIGELDSAVQATRTSVVKIEGEGCGGISVGSGFVADEGLVITNAHVVAGVDRPYIIDSKGQHRTEVIWFDHNLDVAVLRTSGLAGTPLTVSTAVAPSNTNAAALGYPGGGSFTAQPAVVLDSFRAVGRNIYNQGTTEREVYSLKSDIEPGNSGGPLINRDGTVIGLIFAKSTAYSQVGYALTMDAVIAELNQAKDRNQIVDTGSCTA